MVYPRRLKIIVCFTLGLVLSFWAVSRYPVLSSKAAMSGMEAFEDPMTHQAHFHVSHKAPMAKRVWYTTLNWYETNWRGMAFGLALAAAFLTMLSYLPTKSFDQRFKNSFMGMFIGTPLGVCVNCVAPIAKGIYEAGSKMETALAVMFSSPTLNIVILTMLFSIFPFYMALLKLSTTFLLVLVIVPLISEKKPLSHTEGIFEIPDNSVCELVSPSEHWIQALRATCRDYFKSLKYISVRTVPLMLLAGFMGAALSHLWSFEQLVAAKVTIKSLALMSFMGTFMPLPIAFDLMLAQTLMMSGLAAGFVMTLLFTLGTFSIYSALIIYRTFSLKLALLLYFIVFSLGIGLGYSANFYSEYRYVKWLEQYDVLAAEESLEKPGEISISENSKPIAVFNSSSFIPTSSPQYQLIHKKDTITIESFLHRPRIQKEKKSFTKIPGPELGIDYSNTISPASFFDPFYFGRGIASGDINRDGWTDIAIATNTGFEIYQNIEGRRFQKIFSTGEKNKWNQAINIALVDLNNDGWLDIFYTVFDGDNTAWLNPLGKQYPSMKKTVPKGEALVTSASTFFDLNGDGYLDIVNGNYFLGILSRKPIRQATDQLIINNNLKFSLHELEGIPGQTHTALLSDIDGNGSGDLIIGNDYRIADTFYAGASGNLKKIRKKDGLIPVTTQNTMSVDVADFNNDLRPDIYLANIGLTRGIDVVSNIFGDTMQNAGIEFCNSGRSIIGTQSCQEILKLVTLLNPEKQDISERCFSLKDRNAAKECMITRLAMLAAERKNPSLCDKISANHHLGKILCTHYFEAKPMKFSRSEEIPMRTFSNVLLKGTEKGFKDVSENSGISLGEWSWNAKFADLDNDEWQDLYVVNGVLITQDFTPNSFFHNRKGNGFVKAEAIFGLDQYDHSSSYVFLDWDNDGDLDIIANTLYGPFVIYVNNESEKNSVTFKLRDNRGNRFCIGCKVFVYYGTMGKRHQFREIKAGGGFHSFDAPELHFGLDKFDKIHTVEIIWSTGEKTKIQNEIPVNRLYRITRDNENQTN